MIVEIIIEIVGKQERRSCFFTFLDCGPILSEGPPGGGGRDADTHIHTYTYTYTYVSQSRVKTDLSQRPLGCVCMYVYVCVEQCKNDKV